MLLLCMILIFIENLQITTSGNEMLPALKLNDPNLGDLSECSTELEASNIVSNAVGQEDEVTVVLSDMVTKASTLEPMKRLSEIISNFLYGRKIDGEQDSDPINHLTTFNAIDNQSKPAIRQFPSGRVMHAELFWNKTGVHLPSPDLLHTEHCRLRLTEDFMQTAVDAFAIVLDGSLTDVLALPSHYVLLSARTISIMKIPQEKLSAMWDVVLDGKKANTITYETLEMYRPLFKYLNGKQIARLNLSDTRILNYIGTHPELNRHQVGVVASKYIKINPDWKEAKYLSNMNNLLCGVPMSFMRRIDGAEYLRLEHQVFFHVRACDPLQKRFYLNMMTRTQALGKSFSWSARDVSRLGLLLAEVDGPALACVSPEAMAGISSHVMAEIKPENLKYITEMQMQYIKPKAKNILSRKLKQYEALIAGKACRATSSLPLSLLLMAIISLRIVMKQ